MVLNEKPFESITGNGENAAGNQHFLSFSLCFQLNQQQKSF